VAQLAYVTTTELMNLIRAASGGSNFPIRILNNTELGLGPDPFKPSIIIDLSDESFRPAEDAPPMPPVTPTVRSRTTGSYVVTIDGQDIGGGSLWEALGEALRRLEELKPGVLEKLSQVKGRTKRIVAKDPKDLFDKEESAVKFATRLKDGWYFGRNNSAAETNSWLMRAADLADVELKTNF